MQYSAHAQLVNVLFVAIIFIVPVGYCLSDPSIPTEIGRTVIVLSFALGAFVIADWYHFYMGNSYKGLLNGIGLGLGACVLSVLLASLVSGVPVQSLAALEAVEDWGGIEWLLRMYITGVGVAAAALVSIPRLLLIRWTDGGELPYATDA